MKYNSLILFSCVGCSSLFAEPEKTQEQPKQNPTTFQCTEDRPGFFFTADYLYWSFSEGGLAFASVSNTPLVEGAASTKITIENQNHGWHSGFRIGAGGRLPHDNWDLYLNWTYFNFTNERSIHRENSVLPLFSPLGAVASSAKSKWHLNFETLDLELGKFFENSRFLLFRPFIGVQGALINQSQNIAYGGLSGGSFALDHIHRKNDFLAIGPRFGCDTRWILGAGIGIVGNIAGDLLFGKFDRNAEFTGPSATGKVRANSHFLSPNLQIALGVDWAYCFKNKQVLWLGANYETQFWWSQWMAPALFSCSRSEGDLGSQGLTVQFRYDF